jgi:ProP effector
MRRDNGYEKPAVVVRKKVGRKTSPTDPTQPQPRQALPVAKTETPADPPRPSTQPQPPETAPQPQPIEEAALSKTAERKRRRSEILEILRTRWPQTFPRDFRQLRPWAIGIAQDVVRLLPEQPPLSVRDAIGIYRLLATPSYCRALLQGGSRYDLDGNPRGEVTPEDQERAQRDLQAWHDRRKERQKRLAAEKAGTSPEA